MMLRQQFEKVFGNIKPIVIGMIHVKPTPGSPKSCHSVADLAKMAVTEAKIYKDAGVDSVIIENMWDVPYLHTSDINPELVASLTRVSCEVKDNLPLSFPCGIQVLAGGNKEAVAICKAANLQYARIESFIFSHVADEGWMDACAPKLLRYRRQINAEEILLFADIKKKHSAHAVTADVSINEMAKAAEFFLADGVILTGTSTGMPANSNELKDIQKECSLPVFIGSGITLDNIEKYMSADGFIIGSYFKKGGKWCNDLDESKISEFVSKVNKLRDPYSKL